MNTNLMKKLLALSLTVATTMPLAQAMESNNNTNNNDINDRKRKRESDDTEATSPVPTSSASSSSSSSSAAAAATATAEARYQCPVCARPIDDSQSFRITTCGHVFHTDCLNRLPVNSTTACPRCHRQLLSPPVPSSVPPHMQKLPPKTPRMAFLRALAQKYPLHYYTMIGGADIMKVLLDARDAGGNPVYPVNAQIIEDGSSDNGNTPLHIAVLGGQRSAIINILLDGGANINAKNNRGDTPLVLAAHRNPTAFECIVKFLIAKHANINATNLNGDTFLHFAAGLGNADAVKFLIANNADIHIKNRNGETPLAIAQRRLLSMNQKSKEDTNGSLMKVSNYEIIINALQKAAVDHLSDVPPEIIGLMAAQITKKDIYSLGQTARHFNEITKSPEMLKTLTQAEKDRALFKAAGTGNETLVTKLIKAGANVKSTTPENYIPHAPLNQSQWTPLDHAAYNGHIPIARILLDHGAVITIRSGLYSNFTTLLLAAQNQQIAHDKQIEMVQFLINNSDDANVTARINNSGDTLLHSAACGTNTALVDLLINTYKMDVNDQNHYNQTPLYLATTRNNAATVKHLLDTHNADATIDATIKDNSRATGCAGFNTPLEEAVTQGHIESMDVLLDWDKKQPMQHAKHLPLLNTALSNDQYTLAAKLLTDRAADIDINFQDTNGNTPLHIAIQRGAIDFAKQLLAMPDIDINIKNHNGNAPLHEALLRDNDEITENLLQSPSLKINILDRCDNTPLHNAVTRKSKDFIRLLLNKGADVNLQNYLGNTALHLVATDRRRYVSERKEIVALLLEVPGIKVKLKNFKGETARDLANGKQIATLIKDAEEAAVVGTSSIGTSSSSKQQ